MATRLERSLGAGDAVWVIRRLAIEADVNAGWDAGQMAAAVTIAVERALARDLVGSGDGVNVIRFENRAAHLAQYLVDCVDGAGDRWYHHRFDGLKMLPVDTAIRTALTASPADGLEALHRLDRVARRRVVSRLTADGAERVLAAWAAMPGAASVDDCAMAAATRWRSQLRFDAAAASPIEALTLFVETADETRTGAPLARAVHLVLQLVAGTPINAASPELSHLALTSILDVLQPEVPANAAVADPAAPRWTRFGGVFLLLTDIEVDALATLAAESDEGGLRLRGLALLTLALCLEGSTPGALAGDAAVRDLFTLPPSFDLGALWDEMSGDERQALQDAADRTLIGFAHRLPGFASSSRDFLLANVLDVCASIERQPGRLVVRLGRPPLHVMLSITGLNRRRYELPWLIGVPIEIFPGE